MNLLRFFVAKKSAVFKFDKCSRRSWSCAVFEVVFPCLVVVDCAKINRRIECRSRRGPDWSGRFRWRLEWTGHIWRTPLRPRRRLVRCIRWKWARFRAQNRSPPDRTLRATVRDLFYCPLGRWICSDWPDCERPWANCATNWTTRGC